MKPFTLHCIDFKSQSKDLSRQRRNSAPRKLKVYNPSSIVLPQQTNSPFLTRSSSSTLLGRRSDLHDCLSSVSIGQSPSIIPDEPFTERSSFQHQSLPTPPPLIRKTPLPLPSFRAPFNSLGSSPGAAPTPITTPLSFNQYNFNDTCHTFQTPPTTPPSFRRSLNHPQTADGSFRRRRPRPTQCPERRVVGFGTIRPKSTRDRGGRDGWRDGDCDW
ncbi:hypothetical protein BLNAU_2386 [Blattamonas nauphoetae]|uniref:Uncharacterized protein n=1 Tax=Blattamonas nauphoetae TaxID=2049346 RepID=A0ABQ9YG41_9EUKA|nr:hypothetical protein BLNAU_2386 [Blattamonas nauphoetae]